jgi:hypothetical protein
MWLITTFMAALSVTTVGFFAPKRYKLGLLSMMLWGASIMIFVDHVLGYMGGEFLEMQTEGLIIDGVVLGIVMLIPVFTIWGIMVLVSKIKGGSEWSASTRRGREIAELKAR